MIREPDDFDDLLGVATSVSDGASLDWAMLEASERAAADPALVRELWLIARIAEEHRRAAREDSAHAGPGAEQRWGHLVIKEELGTGSFGVVYRAHDPHLERDVALKIYKTTARPDSSLTSLFAEGRLLARVRHQNVVVVHGIEQHGDEIGLWLELVDGRTLANEVRSGGPLGFREAALIGQDVCRALAAVHSAGVIHRDVKAQNVMRERGGRIVLMDFGIGRDLHAPVTTGTDPGGTPLYMAPELFEGGDPSIASDIYSLGVLLFFLVTGSYPVVATIRAELERSHRERRQRLLRDVRADVPDAFVDVIDRACAPEPPHRYATVGAMQAALTGVIGFSSEHTATSASRTPSSHLGRWMAGIAGMAALVVIAVVASFWLRAPAPRDQPQAPLVAVRETRFTQVTFDGNVHTAALSPDGQSVAYGFGEEGKMRVAVRDLTGGLPLEIWKSDVTHLRWLPNGSQLIASTPDGVWLLPRLGGAARRLTTTHAAFLAPSPDGRQIAHGSANTRGFRLSSMEETSDRMLELPGFQEMQGLDWNVATNRIWLFTFDTEGKSVIWVVGSDGNDPQRVYSDVHLINFMCSSPTSGAAYFLRQRDGTDELVKLTTPLPAESQIVLARVSPPPPVTTGAVCNISGDGSRLLYLGETAQSNLWRLDVQSSGRAVNAFTRGTARFHFPKVSPDGQWVIASEGRETSLRLVKFPINGGDAIPLTAGANGSLAPDGQRLAYKLDVPGSGPQVWISDADGRGATALKDAATTLFVAPTWLPDGRLAWQTPDARDYRIRDLNTGREERLAGNSDQGWVFYPQFSPREDQVAVYWNRKPNGGLWLLSWPERKARFLARDLRPVGWTADGEWIYASPSSDSRTRTITRVSVRTGKIEEVGSFPQGHLRFDPCTQTPDRRSIICALTESNTDAFIIDGFDRR